MSGGITVAQKVKNQDLLFKWGAFSYISHFAYTTWLWLNFLHMTLGIYIPNLVVIRKGQLFHHKRNKILQIVSVNISSKLYGHFLDKILHIFKYILIYMYMHNLLLCENCWPFWWLNLITCFEQQLTSEHRNMCLF